MALEPHPPFDAWPAPGADAAAGLLVWFVAPATVVFQHCHELVDGCEARAIVRVLDEVFDREPRAYRECGGLLMIHDLRLVTGMTFEAQRTLRDAWSRRNDGDARGVVLAGLKTSFFMMRVVHTIAAAAKLFTATEFDVLDFDAAVQKYGLTGQVPPPRAA
jgi:hypothetical protein